MAQKTNARDIEVTPEMVGAFRDAYLRPPTVRNQAMLAGVALAALLFAAQAPVWAQGNKSGHETETTMGESGNPPPNDNAADSGGTKTTSGPKGQVDKGNTDCNNCTSSGPGNK
jgi:hypothetical protein